MAWPDLPGSYNLVLKVVDVSINLIYQGLKGFRQTLNSPFLRCIFLLQAICSSAAYYAEITHQKLADSGYYEDQTPYKTSDEVIAEVETASH